MQPCAWAEVYAVSCAVDGPQPLGAHGLAQRLVAGDQQAQEVGHRGARDEHAGGVGREGEYLREPARHLALDVDADVVAAAAVGVEPGSQHLGQHADGRARAVHPAQEQRVRVARDVRLDVAREVGEHALEVPDVAGQRRPEARARCLGRRLPDGPVLDGAEMGDDLVERRWLSSRKRCQSPGSRLRSATATSSSEGTVSTILALRRLETAAPHDCVWSPAFPVRTSPNFRTGPADRADRRERVLEGGTARDLLSHGIDSAVRSRTRAGPCAARAAPAGPRGRCVATSARRACSWSPRPLSAVRLGPWPAPRRT